MSSRLLLAGALIFLALALVGVFLLAIGPSQRGAKPAQGSRRTMVPQAASPPQGTPADKRLRKSSEGAVFAASNPAAGSGGPALDRIISLATMLCSLIGSVLCSSWLHDRAKPKREARERAAAAAGPVRDDHAEERVAAKQTEWEEILSVVLPVGRSLALKPGRITIGRNAHCDLSIQDAGISRRHAQIGYDGRACLLIDLGTTNGTALNGQVLRPHRVLPMPPGSVVITGGQASFRLETGRYH